MAQFDNGFHWDAESYFRKLAQSNKLAIEHNFHFCSVSGLQGFEDAVLDLQHHNAFICVSDTSDGTVELSPSPKTTRVVTIFLALRHPIGDTERRKNAMSICRELFRQFATATLRQSERIEQGCIYIDPRISFHEIDQFFLSGCACALFSISVSSRTSLIYDPNEWQ